MAELIIMIGNIGSGKSTIARKYAQRGYVIVNMDSIQQSIHGGEYGMYNPELKQVYASIENEIINSSLYNNIPVVVDRTNMDAKRRKRFIEIGNGWKSKIKAIDFGSGSAQGYLNRFRYSRGITVKTWQSVYENMLSSYEAPTIEEGFHEIIIAPEKYRYYAFDFDGTLVKNEFPTIGKPTQLVDHVRKLSQCPSNIIIIWTCRSGEYLKEMKQWLIKNKVPFDFINENPMCDFGSPKIFAHEYHDDRNKNLLT